MVDNTTQYVEWPALAKYTQRIIYAIKKEGCVAFYLFLLKMHQTLAYLDNHFPSFKVLFLCFQGQRKMVKGVQDV